MKHSLRGLYYVLHIDFRAAKRERKLRVATTKSEIYLTGEGDGINRARIRRRAAASLAVRDMRSLPTRTCTRVECHHGRRAPRCYRRANNLAFSKTEKCATAVRISPPLPRSSGDTLRLRAPDIAGSSYIIFPPSFPLPLCTSARPLSPLGNRHQQIRLERETPMYR